MQREEIEDATIKHGTIMVDTEMDVAVPMNHVRKTKGIAQTIMNAYRAMCVVNVTVPRKKDLTPELTVASYQVVLTNSVS